MFKLYDQSQYFLFVPSDVVWSLRTFGKKKSLVPKCSGTLAQQLTHENQSLKTRYFKMALKQTLIVLQVQVVAAG